MNNKDFIVALARKTEFSAEKTQQMLQSVVDFLSDRFQEGDTLTVPIFGTFEVKTKKERIMVSPTTKQRMLVPPKRALAFRPTVAWKDKLKNGGNE